MDKKIVGNHFRTLDLERKAVNEEARTVELALSSETPVERWFGLEILGHKKGEVDLVRMRSGAPLLVDHNTRDQVGVVENARLDEDRVLRCVVRFGRSQRAEEIFRDVLDGIRSKVSVGYQILRYETTKGEKGGSDTVRATRWMPMEASIVAVPADDTVGVGRSHGPEEARTPNPPAALAGTTEVRMDKNPEVAATPAVEPTKPAPVAEPTKAPEVRQLLTTEVRNFLSQAEKLFGTEGRTVAEEILGQTQDLGRAGNELLAKFASKPLPAPPSLESLGASRREVKDYSYGRALQFLVDQAEGRGPKRGLEVEVSDTLLRSMPIGFTPQGGIIVPVALRTLVSGTPGGAKELVETDRGELIPLLRNMAVALKMGARFLSGLSAPVTFPKVTGGGVASWVAENPGSDVGDTQFATGSLTLSPKTLQASTPISRQLLYTSSEDAEAMIREDLALAHALAWDKAVLHGSGSANQPTGIYAAAGVNATSMGGNPTFGKLVDMVTEIAKDNALLGTVGYVTTPAVAGKLMQTLVASAAGSDMVWTGTIEDGRLNGYRAMASNQVATNLGAGTNEHGLVVANWAQALIAQFGPGFELIVDPYAKKKQGLVEFTSFQMVDIGLRYPEAFTKATGLILS